MAHLRLVTPSRTTTVRPPFPEYADAVLAALRVIHAAHEESSKLSDEQCRQLAAALYLSANEIETQRKLRQVQETPPK